MEKIKVIEKDIQANKVGKADILFAKYLAAFLYRRHGENAQALKWITQLQKESGQNSVIDDAVTKALKSIETETHFQKLAIQAYKSALDKGDYKREHVPEVQFLEVRLGLNRFQ